jgi:hypothetical protein
MANRASHLSPAYLQDFLYLPRLPDRNKQRESKRGSDPLVLGPLGDSSSFFAGRFYPSFLAAPRQPNQWALWRGDGNPTCGQSLDIARNVLPSDKWVGDGHPSYLLPILKVFAVENVALTFDRRSENQRIEPSQSEPGSNPQCFSIQC